MIASDPAPTLRLGDPPASERGRLLAELAAALGAVRRARGLRQADVAAIMGTSQSCVSDFERAKANPQLDFIARYAAAVGARLRVDVVPSGHGSAAWKDPLRHAPLDVRGAGS